MKRDCVFVEPDGTFLVGKHRLRASFGNPYSEASLFGESPLLVPWHLQSLAREVGKLHHLPPDLAKRIASYLKDSRRVSLDLTLLPAINRDLFTTAAPYKGLVGGRQSTKSVSAVDYFLLAGLARPRTYLCLREFFTSIRASVQETFGSRIADLGLSRAYRVQNTEVIGTNGSKFIFKGIGKDPDGAKSVHGLAGIWVEEAQNISARSWKILLPIARESGCELIFTWNRTSEDDPVDRFFFNSPPEGAQLLLSNYKDNPWLTYQTSRLIEHDRERDVYEYEHVWGGGPQTRPDALVLRHWQEGDLDEEVKQLGLEPIFGLDFGTTDPLACVCLFVLPNKRLYVAHEFYRTGVELGDLASELIEAIPSIQHAPIVADSASPDIIRHLQSAGLNVIAAAKGPGSVARGIRALNSHDLYIHRSCEATIFEAKNYSMHIDPKTDIPTQRPIDKHNHAIDALRYALEGWERKHIL